MIIAVDMPIGLPDRIVGSGRGPEQAIRPFLGERQSSVFAIPARDAVYAVTPQPVGMEALREGHQRASALAKELSEPPRGASFQAFNLFPKIREIDAALRANQSARRSVRESHPELAFCRLNGMTPLANPKKIKGKVNPDGVAERRSLLGAAGLPRTAVHAAPPKGAALDDWIDALAMLVTAREIARCGGKPYPDPPSTDRFGLPIAIWSW